MKISIIIPVFNRPDLIVNTLLSIKKQTYVNFECIVVDDGSTDNTMAVIMECIQDDSRFILVTRPDTYKSGGNGARNYGLDVSVGQWINWFDSDDIMLPNFIQDKVDLIDDQTNLVIAPHENINDKGELIKKHHFYVKHSLLEDYVYWEDNLCLVTNNVLFSKQFLLQHNLRLNENLKRCQEAELFSTAFSLNPNTKISSNITFLYLVHSGNKTSINQEVNLRYKEDFVYVNITNFRFAVNNNLLALAYYLNCRLIDDLQKYNGMSRRFSWNIYKQMTKILLPNKLQWGGAFLLLPIFILTNYKFPLSQRVFYRNIFK